MKRAHASGKAGPAFDQQHQDVLDDLEDLRRKEWGQWKAAAERKYGFAIQKQKQQGQGALSAPAATKGDESDER